MDPLAMLIMKLLDFIMLIPGKNKSKSLVQDKKSDRMNRMNKIFIPHHGKS